MTTKMKYQVTGIANNQTYYKNISAYTPKQAIYLFQRIMGFHYRNLQAQYISNVKGREEDETTNNQKGKWVQTMLLPM